MSAPDRERPLIVIQARTGSRRLPGKVLGDLCGTPVLAWLVERLLPTRRAAGLVVATSTLPGDDPVARLCDQLGVPVFRGHPTDVLSRYVAAAAEHEARSLVRISADCPLLEHAVADAVIEAFEAGDADLVQNHRQPAWPFGTAVEVLTADCLGRLDRLATDPRHREHVTLFAYEHPELFAIEFVPPPPALHAPDLHLCVDTADDLERLRGLCARFGGPAELRLEGLAAGGPD